VKLKDLSSGVDARVVAVHADGEIGLRLKEMGIRPGAGVQVLQHAGIAGRLLALGCERIAVDVATAGGIDVEVKDNP
jgi:ferrous iron transport protein A